MSSRCGVKARLSRLETADRHPMRTETSPGHYAPDILHVYEALGEAQLENFKKFTAAFEPLYASLPDNQKRIADAVMRESAQNAMIGGLPVAPGPFGYPLGDSSLSVVPGIPLFGYRLGGFHRFHGFMRK